MNITKNNQPYNLVHSLIKDCFHDGFFLLLIFFLENETKVNLEHFCVGV